VASGRASPSAFVTILEYIEQGALHDDFDFSEKPSAEAKQRNDEIRNTKIELYLCPSMILPREVPDWPCAYENGAAGSYALNTGSGNPWLLGAEFNGAFVKPPFRTTIANISQRDGATKTLLVGELDFGLQNFLFTTCREKYGQVRGGGTIWANGYAGSSWASTFGVYDSDRVVAPGTNCEWATFRSDHPTGSNFVMAGGSVQFISSEVDARVLDGLATRAGGERVRVP